VNKKVLRRFYFYDFDLYTLNPVTNTVEPAGDFKTTVIKLFDKISKLEHKDEEPYGDNTVLYKTQNGDFLFTIIDNLKDTIDIRFVASRNNALPHIDQDGKLVPLLDLLPGNKGGLAEVTHLVIFPEYKVIGSEFNFYGPRPSALIYYIQSKELEIKYAEMNPKVNKDAIKKLREDSEYSLFRIDLKPSSMLMKELLKDESLLQATDTNRNVDSIEVAFKRRITKKKPGFSLPIDIEKIKCALTSTDKENIRNFKIRNEHYRDEIDLLSDQFAFKESLLPLNNSRSIKKEDAYDKIKYHFNDTVKKYCIKIG